MRYLSMAAVLGVLAGLGLLLSNYSASADEKPNGGGVAGWGTIKGQVVLKDGVEVPKPVKLNVDKDMAHCLSKGNIFSEEWVVNKNRGVRDVFVWLTPDPTDRIGVPPIHPDLKAIKTKEVAFDQPCCKFEPHALAIRVGQLVVAKNSSPISHNTNYVYGNPVIPAGGSYTIKDLTKPEKVPLPIKCNIHGWMSARIGVFAHPYFALTDESGDFEIKDAPAGDFYLIINHEGAGWRDREEKKVDGKKVTYFGTKITIKANAVTNLGKLDIKPSE
jgi:hypothetical protein